MDLELGKLAKMVLCEGAGPNRKIELGLLCTLQGDMVVPVANDPLAVRSWETL